MAEQAGITTGSTVAFEHAGYGRLTGCVVRLFKNGKAQVECAPRISAADGKSGIRKTTYSIHVADLVAVSS